MLEPENSSGLSPINPYQNILEPSQLQYLKERMNLMSEQDFLSFIDFIEEVAIVRLQDARTLKTCKKCGKKILEDETT